MVSKKPVISAFFVYSSGTEMHVILTPGISAKTLTRREGSHETLLGFYRKLGQGQRREYHNRRPIRHRYRPAWLPP